MPALRCLAELFLDLCFSFKISKFLGQDVCLLSKNNQGLRVVKERIIGEGFKCVHVDFFRFRFFYVAK